MSLGVSSDRTKITGSPPDCMETVPDNAYTSATMARKTGWWANFASLLGTTPTVIWNKHDFSASLPEIAAFANSIAPDFNSIDKAMGLANWMGGGGIYNNPFIPDAMSVWLLKDLPAYGDSNHYLDPGNIYTEGTTNRYNVGDLLAYLKKVNPAAHYYLVSKVYAKAKRVAASLDDGYSWTNNPTVNNTLAAISSLANSGWNTALGAIDALKSGAEGVGTGFSILAFLYRNWWWILPGTAAATGYVIYRNRKVITRVAMATTPQGRALAMTPQGQALLEVTK